jgi:hypothetical protein
MHLDRWREVVAQIQDNFTVEEYTKTASAEAGGETVERIIFTGPLGRLKLEFTSRPKVIDKKVSYSNRIGSQSTVEYIYSPDARTYQLLVYRWSDADDDWLPLEGQNLFD